MITFDQGFHFCRTSFDVPRILHSLRHNKIACHGWVLSPCMFWNFFVIVFRKTSFNWRLVSWIVLETYKIQTIIFTQPNQMDTRDKTSTLRWTEQRRHKSYQELSSCVSSAWQGVGHRMMKAERRSFIRPSLKPDREEYGSFGLWHINKKMTIVWMSVSLSVVSTIVFWTASRRLKRPRGSAPTWQGTEAKHDGDSHSRRSTLIRRASKRQRSCCDWHGSGERYTT